MQIKVLSFVKAKFYVWNYWEVSNIPKPHVSTTPENTENITLQGKTFSTKSKPYPLQFTQRNITALLGIHM